jgi:hypothetical protein
MVSTIAPTDTDKDTDTDTEILRIREEDLSQIIIFPAKSTAMPAGVWSEAKVPTPPDESFAMLGLRFVFRFRILLA